MRAAVVANPCQWARVLLLQLSALALVGVSVSVVATQICGTGPAPGTGSHAVPVECPTGAAPRCIDNGLKPRAAVPVNLTIGLIGDQGVGAESRQVLQMLLGEGVEMIIHVGDFSYDCSGTSWEDNINSVVGADFPYYAAGGNHDIDVPSSASTTCQTAWSHPTTGYQKRIYDRMVRTGAECKGEVGINTVCTYKGLSFVLSGVGTQGSRQEDFVAQSFASYGTQWRICAWHKNQNSLQLGGKGDEVGWQAYEVCRQHGAMVLNGHEHSYARSYTMTHMETKTLANTNNDVHVNTNESFVLVSGVAGVGVRICQGTHATDPWWAAAECADTGLQSGGVICKFNCNGAANQACCYFKEFSGRVLDEWVITTHMPAYSTPPPPPPPSDNVVCDIVVQAAAVDDDAEQPAAGGATSCSSTDLELTEDQTTQQVVGIRFATVGPLNSSADAYNITGAWIGFTCDELHSGSTSLVIYGHAADNSPAFCSGGSPDILPRAKTTSSVAWTGLPVWSVSEHYLTPNLAPIIREIISRPGWQSGNALTFIIEGSGRRTADSAGNGCGPVLWIEMTCRTGSGDWTTSGSVAITTASSSTSTTGVELESTTTGIESESTISVAQALLSTISAVLLACAVVATM